MACISLPGHRLDLRHHPGNWWGFLTSHRRPLQTLVADDFDRPPCWTTLDVEVCCRRPRPPVDSVWASRGTVCPDMDGVMDVGVLWVREVKPGEREGPQSSLSAGEC